MSVASNIIEDLPDHLLPSIFVYANVSDLKAIDATCRGFQSLTDPHWKTFAMAEFGIDLDSGGKSSWRKGRSLVKPKYGPCIFKLIDPPEYGWLYAGSPIAKANDNFLVWSSDDIGSGLTNADIFDETPMAFRDTRTLNFIRTRNCPFPPHVLAICGPECAEIVLAANNSGDLSAHRGETTQIIDWATILPDGQMSIGYIELLGSKTHAIALCCGYIHLFSVGTQSLLNHISSTMMLPDISSMNFDAPFGACWGSNSSVGSITFAFACVPCKIHIWSLDETNNQLIHVQDVEYYPENTANMEERDRHDDAIIEHLGGADPPASALYQTIAVTDRYVAGNVDDGIVQVYDRSTGERLHNLIEKEHPGPDGFDDDDDDEDEALLYPIYMVAIGDLLVTSSMRGNAICVWQMKTGTLLKSYYQTFTRRISYPLPSGVPVTSMVLLPNFGCTAFVTVAGELTVFAFPENAKEEKKLDLMKQREAIARKRSHDAVDGEDDGDY
ncbi:hypothetical protein MPSEU_000197300 [Mayamaea pseudoterrestris]|nr:hypothetical protein MPSEU_000197300 [Mayamaea pseudoterrestris]